ncbi:MAG: hypothetical protein QM477_03695 [Planctomycetota bacterium]
MASGGQLGGFTGGTDLKIALLAAEAIDFDGGVAAGLEQSSV